MAPKHLAPEQEGPEWFRYPLLAAQPEARRWLESEYLLGLAPNTIDAYGRGVEDFLAYCRRVDADPVTVTRETIARYVGDLRRRPGPRGANVVTIGSGAGLSNATLQQRLTAVRLFFDFLVEDAIRETNPVGRGRYTPGRRFTAKDSRGLIPRMHKLPWIPNEQQWAEFLASAREEPVRNRCMLALAYDAALRREELCLLRTDDLDPAQRLIRIRAETTKGRRARVVPYSAATGQLLRGYLEHRRAVGRSRGPLFLSESRRNYASPLTLWTWSKVVRRIADRAELPQFSTHTLRHLCLTDLARAGWDLHEIATFAGHRDPQTTQQYIHLSGRELTERLAQGMQQIHAWRVQALAGATDRAERQ